MTIFGVFCSNSGDDFRAHVKMATIAIISNSIITWSVQKVSGFSEYLKKGKSYVDKIWCALRGHLTRYLCKSAILCVNPVGNGISLSGGMLGVSVELSFFKQCICNGIDNGSEGCLNGQKCC